MEMTKYSREGNRALSRFHAEEMIYEYCTGKLDPIRKKLVKEAIESEPTLATDLARIQRALSYCEELSGWPVTIKETEALRGTKTSPIDLIIEKTRIQHWPSGLRLGLESLVVVTAIFGISVLVPWNKLMDAVQSEKGTFTIAEIRRDFRLGERRVSTEFAASDDKIPIYDDEGFPEEVARQLGRPVAEAMQIVPQLFVPPAPIKPEISEQPVKAVPRNLAAEQAALAAAVKIASEEAARAEKAARLAATKAPASTAPAVVASTGAIEGAEDTSAGPESGALKGWLYRGRLDVTNIEAVTPKLVQFIDGLGGRKAGNVPLGWKSGPGGSYFHLTLPEAKYQDLQNALKGYGQLNLEKHSHGRVMPEGIIRLIVEVKEKKAPEIRKSLVEVKEKKAPVVTEKKTEVKKEEEPIETTETVAPAVQESEPATDVEPREPATDQAP